MEDGTDDIFTHADFSMKITIHLPAWPRARRAPALFPEESLLHQQQSLTKQRKTKGRHIQKNILECEYKGVIKPARRNKASEVFSFWL